MAKLFKKIIKKKDVTPSKPKDRLEEYIDLMKAEDLQELEISDGPFQLKLVRESKVVYPSQPVHVPVESSEDTSSKVKESEPVVEGTQMKAPLGGVFYRSPSPKSPPFVKEGDTVFQGQPLGIIEAMKVMNEIHSEVSGRIVKILIENGKSVDANQTMFIISTEK